jgi:hypothetical protein
MNDTRRTFSCSLFAVPCERYFHIGQSRILGRTVCLDLINAMGSSLGEACNS